MTIVTADSTYTADSNNIAADGLLGAIVTPVLPYQPDNALKVKVRPGVHSVKFGDGYGQRVAKGINNKLQVWSVTYENKTQSVGETLFNFFDGLGGVDYFEWTPPGEASARRFIAPEYEKDFPYGGRPVQSITTTFEEVPA